jgi:hypothetical protein
VSATTVRNIAIIAALALAIVMIPGESEFRSAVIAIVSLGFLAAIGLLGQRLYRGSRLTLWGMSTHHRATLYGALAVAFMTLVATSRLWDSGVGTVVWIALLAGSGLAAFRVWTEARRYGI